MLNKGAMFGLDARIALAIFGALSVISGAALYNAIQTAKAEQYRQFFLETIKASEAYYLDVGSPIGQGNGTTALSNYLVENVSNIKGWKGPYISGDSYSGYYIKNDLTRRISTDAYFAIYLYKKSSPNSLCVIGDIDCTEYHSLRYEGLQSELTTDSAYIALQGIFDKLDELIDEGDGPSDGIIRLSHGGAASSYNKTLRYKTNMQRKRY